MIGKSDRLRIPLIAACGSLSLLLGGGWAGAQERDNVTIQRDITVKVDGQTVPFADIGPQQIEGRTLVPVRGVLEKLGADVGYNSASQMVTATSPNTEIRMRIGSRRALVNGRPVTLDVPAQTIEDRTFVPLRFLSEALGARITWNEATRTVMIRTRGMAGEDSAAMDDRANPPLRDRDTVRTDNDRDTAVDRDRRTNIDADARNDQDGTNRPRYRLRDRNTEETGNRTDGPAPVAFEVSPANNAVISNTRPEIVARFRAPNGSGIDTAGTRLTFDGDDVTSLASITAGSITFTPRRALKPGMHDVELRIADRSGNQKTRGWVFKVEPRETAGIVSITGNLNRVSRVGDTVRVEMSGAPGGRAYFSVGDFRDVEMFEDRPGHYTGEIRVRTGDEIPTGAITGRLDMPDGQRYRRVMSSSLADQAVAPSELRITSPRAGDAPTSPMIVRGRATPGARVTIQIEYRDDQPGSDPVRNNAAEVTAYANRDGYWETRPLDVSGIMRRTTLDYTIRATSRTNDNNRLETTSLRFSLPQ